MSVEMYATHLTLWSALGLKDCKSGPANQLDESTVHPSLLGVSDVYAALPRQRAGRIEEQASGQSEHQNNHKDSNWKVEKVKHFTIFHNSNLKIDGFNYSPYVLSQAKFQFRIFRCMFRSLISWIFKSSTFHVLDYHKSHFNCYVPSTCDSDLMPTEPVRIALIFSEMADLVQWLQSMQWPMNS